MPATRIMFRLLPAAISVVLLRINAVPLQLLLSTGNVHHCVMKCL